MKSRKKADAVATIGKYKDPQTGEEKKRYANVGTLFESDGRLSLKLDTIPIGPGWSGYIQFFEPKPHESQLPRSEASPETPVTHATDTQEEDDLPF